MYLMEIAVYMIHNAIRYVQTSIANQFEFVCHRKGRNFQFLCTTFVMIEFNAKKILH
jgi:hypothetical protein